MRVIAILYFDTLLDALRAVSDLRGHDYQTNLDELHDDPAFVKDMGDTQSYCVEAWREVPPSRIVDEVCEEIFACVSPIAEKHEGLLYEWGYVAPPSLAFDS
jgi:hypothetical protein